MIEHTLSKPDQDSATVAGKGQFQRRKKSKHLFNRPDDYPETLSMTIDRKGSEIATARVIGSEWHDSPVPDHPGDIGYGLQVRHTYNEERHRCRLIVHGPDYDSDEHVFFLTTGRMPTFTVWGWMTGRDARKLGAWRVYREDGGAYYVDRLLLNRIEEFWLPFDRVKVDPTNHALDDLPPTFFLEYPGFDKIRKEALRKKSC